MDRTKTLSSTEKLSPFHVAVPVHDLEEALAFYKKCFDCPVGRRSDQWIDLNLFGHQYVLHLKPKSNENANHHHNPVDGKQVPVPHYGVVLDWDRWEGLAEHLRTIGVNFVIEPYIRFKGETGEQATMFFMDPSGNALEFKAFKDTNQLFAND